MGILQHFDIHNCGSRCKFCRSSLCNFWVPKSSTHKLLTEIYRIKGLDNVNPYQYCLWSVSKDFATKKAQEISW